MEKRREDVRGVRSPSTYFLQLYCCQMQQWRSEKRMTRLLFFYPLSNHSTANSKKQQRYTEVSLYIDTASPPNSSSTKYLRISTPGMLIYVPQILRAHLFPFRESYYTQVQYVARMEVQQHLQKHIVNHSSIIYRSKQLTLQACT